MCKSSSPPPILDNVERRKEVENAVLGADMKPIGMERFVPSTRPTVDECLRLAAEADVFVGILAHRYGWIPPGHASSITELEHEAAKGAHKPRLMFLLNPDLPVNTAYCGMSASRGRPVGHAKREKDTWNA